MKIIHALRGLVISSLFLLCSVASHAQLLTGAYETQLESWLDQGDLQFSNIFTKVTGNTAADFHAASNGKGATFSLMSVSTDNWVTSQIIGGYNPQSWNSAYDWVYSQNNSDRTAFIFNLTDHVIQRQNLDGQGASGSAIYQTHGSPAEGPAFGNGFDLWTGADLNSGYAVNISYGGTSFGQEIVSGTPNMNVGNVIWEGYSYSVRDLEVYTVAAIPEPSTYAAILGVATLGFVTIRRRRAAV